MYFVTWGSVFAACGEAINWGAKIFKNLLTLTLRHSLE